jgi:hypothetical protein
MRERIGGSRVRELDAFRHGARLWLDAGCPAPTREPTGGEEDIVRDGRRHAFRSGAERVPCEGMAGIRMPGTAHLEFGDEPRTREHPPRIARPRPALDWLTSGILGGTDTP